MAKKLTSIPLLPLRDTVVFPGSVASLYVGRDKSKEAVSLAMRKDRKLAFVAQKSKDMVLPSQDDLYSIGVYCEVLQLLKMPDGTVKILVEGLQRLKLEKLSDEGNVYLCDATLIEDENIPEDVLHKQLLDKVLLELFSNFQKFTKTSGLSGEFLQEIRTLPSVSFQIDAIAHILPMDYKQKQNILETLPLLDRAQKIKLSLNSQLDIASLEKSIHDRVRGQMDKMQRQFYLHEQLKIIKEELGEGEADEIERYREKLKSLELSKDIYEKIDQEISRLEKMPPMSAEGTVVRNYLDWILELPWNTVSEDTKSLSEAAKILGSSHYGLEKVKDRILEFIAVKQLAPTAGGPILCLVGPPGVGKTSLAKTLAECLGRKFVRISLGGVRDEAEIRGHRRTYIGSMPGRVIAALKKAKTKNPVILLDEIDKLSSDIRGNPAAALLEVLDPEQNAEFTDHYLEVPFDLSQVLFVATANVIHSIPPALLDRLEILTLSGYTEEEKIEIAKKFLIPTQIRENGLKKISFHYKKEALRELIRLYTREAGVRELNRCIAQICRKLARRTLEEGKTESFRLTKENLQEMLGVPKYSYGKKEEKPHIGKVNGLAWTSTGGNILEIEAAIAHGQGKLQLTGNLGEVMKESAAIAISYVRTKAHLLKLPDDFFEKNDIFVHVPEGAIPKDGPSAGISIAIATLSALTRIPVKNEIAMTGEITLRGNILPIGGLKEKTLAAYRGNIREMICPKENEKDLEEIPEEIRKKVKFHFV
ncbi:MAG: endopeptidase La, partial [Candidatus Hydrogenedentota bacterium]